MGRLNYLLEKEKNNKLDSAEQWELEELLREGE